MRQSLTILSLLAGAAIAKTSSTVEFFFPGGYEGVDPVATVVEANPTSTILNLACPTGTDSTECGFGSGFEYKIVSTTIYQASVSELDFIMTFSCDHNTQKNEMACGVSIGGDNANDPGTTQVVLPKSQIAFLTATVIAGGELLSAEASATAAEATSVASGVASGVASAATAATYATTAASTGLKTTTSVSATGLASTSSSSEAAIQTTNAAYRYGVEGSALLVLAGAVVANAW